MADLPPEIITEILLRLPVKPLLRLRCICKRWRSLIDSNKFIFFHLNKSREPNIILQNRSRLYQLDSNTIDTVKELHHPLTSHHSNLINILGSSNGLLCISNIVKDIALWNPNIRKHRLLPPEPLIRLDGNTSIFAKVYGFGYDSFSNDFKLLSISFILNINIGGYYAKVKLYTLKTDAWKNLPTLPYPLIRTKTMGVFVGGALHWLASRNPELPQLDLVVAFDLRFESYREVPLPVTVTGMVNGNLGMNLGLLGECLCVIENRSEGFDVWVMKEYGIRDSWCKLFSVEQQHVVKCLKPLGYSRDGDKVLFEMDHSGELCWYNLVSREIINVNISGMHNYSFEGIVCVGSLVPPTLLSPSVHSKNHKLGVKKKRDDFLSKGFKLRL